MATVYVISLDGYEFPRSDIPFRGPLKEITPQRWSKQNVLGTADPGSIMTLLGTESPEWPFVSRASSATIDKLEAVYAAQVPVTIKTPLNPDTGLSVLMTQLAVDYREPIEDSKYLARFTLVKR